MTTEEFVEYITRYAIAPYKVKVNELVHEPQVYGYYYRNGRWLCYVTNELGNDTTLEERDTVAEIQQILEEQVSNRAAQLLRIQRMRELQTKYIRFANVDVFRQCVAQQFMDTGVYRLAYDEDSTEACTLGYYATGNDQYIVYATNRAGAHEEQYKAYTEPNALTFLYALLDKRI